MRKLEVAAHLTDSQYKLLLHVYAQHNSSMGLEKRKGYMLSDVVKVEWDQAEQTVNVYYKNGDWWHYAKDGTWY
jgi:hypothetical protein